MRKRHKLMIVVVIAGIILYIFAVLWYNGIIWLNTPSKKDYPVRGVDVSSYQGEINWRELESQNISFAFIKATEGSGFVDEYFIENYKNSSNTGIRIRSISFFQL